VSPKGRTRREAGFTLIELMMATTLMGVLLGPLGAALVVSLRTTDETANRLAGSNDAQLVSIWLPPDIQSAGDRSGSADPNDDDVVFAPTVNTECSGQTNVLRLHWQETLTTTSEFVAAYAVSQSTDGSWRLVRYACTNGGAPTAHVVARNLAGPSAVEITPDGPQLFMRVTEAPTAANPTSYVFTVSGHRRTA